METVERDYSSQGVKFFYIYKALAHPETNGYVTPFTLEERLQHVAEAKRSLGSRIPWICDTMDNDLKHALGDRPNSEFIIDPEGKVVVARTWSSPSQLRIDLVRLVGKVDRPTRVEDLNMRPLAPPQTAPKGIVSRVALPGGMSPLKIIPLESDIPYYAKLRAEMGSGQLYLGFFLDPLYKVHWNNKAPVIEYTIETPEGVTATPTSGAGPKVDEAVDADPREFLVRVDGRSAEPMKVTVKYFACDDAETFCIPVTQQYLVSFDRDHDGGSRRTARGRTNRSPQMKDRMRQMMSRVPILAALDQDGDGTISSDEIENATTALQSLDQNQDGELSGMELRPR